MDNSYSIKTKKELIDFISSDRHACMGSLKIGLEKALRNPFKYNLFRYFKCLRKYEYLCFKRDKCQNTILSKVLSLRIKIIDIKKNKLSLKLGIEITPFYCGKSTKICHPNVIINGYTGSNCIFHGNNVIGNKKTGMSKAVPKIGNNVDIGIGAVVIGDVIIADNCIIGAGAVVTKSFTTPGTIVAGIPAKEIKGSN